MQWDGSISRPWGDLGMNQIHVVSSKVRTIGSDRARGRSKRLLQELVNVNFAHEGKTAAPHSVGNQWGAAGHAPDTTQTGADPARVRLQAHYFPITVNRHFPFSSQGASGKFLVQIQFQLSRLRWIVFGKPSLDPLHFRRIADLVALHG